MAKIEFTPQHDAMGGALGSIPAFPGETFGLGYPEAIGDAAKTCWQSVIKPEWRQTDGIWKQTGSKHGELSYAMTVSCREDVVDIDFSVTNHSNRVWKQSLAFNCLQCGQAPSICDHDCVRHWVRTGNEFKRLVEVPRQYGPRPTVQLYSVEGAPLGQHIPFVARFKATPHVVLEGWMAIMSRDGKRLVATVSNPALFLFQNMEYSCIHSGSGFGKLRPGETGHARNKVYFVQSSLEDWYKRMKSDFA